MPYPSISKIPTLLKVTKPILTNIYIITINNYQSETLYQNPIAITRFQNISNECNNVSTNLIYNWLKY